jgi:hypothetical protein
MRDNAVERLFSLFLSADAAVAIAGDLAEEREQRGWIWFWLHVVRITFALWRSAATEAPIRVLALMLVGLALLSAPAFGGVAAVLLVPSLMDSPVGWIALPLFWWGGALWTGASLVALAPHRGMAACAMLALTGEALLIGFGGPAVWRDPSNTGFVVFYTAGLAGAVPLLVGGVIARRRMILCGIPTLEQHRWIIVSCAFCAASSLSPRLLRHRRRSGRTSRRM